MIEPNMQQGAGMMSPADEASLEMTSDTGAMDVGDGLEPEPGAQPAEVPVDPVVAAVDAILAMPDADAIRRVYSLAASAARARTRLDAATDRQSSREYHAALSAAPEVRHYKVLVATKRRIDTLAQERRRLTMARIEAEKRGRPTGIYDLQIAQLSTAMGYVAGGALLYITLPDGGLEAPSEPTESAAPMDMGMEPAPLDASSPAPGEPQQ